MKFKDILKLSFLNISRSKKNIYILLIVILCSLISLFSLTVLVSFNHFIENNYYKNIGFRTLNVFYADGSDINKTIDTKKLKQINHVVEVFNSKYATFTSKSNLENSKYDGIITLNAITNNLQLDVVKRENIGTKRNVAICPINFYPDSSASDLNLSLKNNTYDENLIGKKFKFKYSKYNNNAERPEVIENYEKEFEIIGLYNTNTTMTNANQCYVSMDDMKEIVDTVNQNKVTSIYVIVDSLNNVDSVMNKINNLGYYSEVTTAFDGKIINNFSLICNIISLISLSVAVIVLVLYIRKKIINESQNIGVLRSLGYTKKDVKKYYMIEILCSILITYLFSLLIFGLLYVILKNTVLSTLNLYNIEIVINLFVYLTTFSIIVIIPYLLSMISIYKVTNKTILKLMKMEE